MPNRKLREQCWLKSIEIFREPWPATTIHPFNTLHADRATQFNKGPDLIYLIARSSTICISPAPSRFLTPASQISCRHLPWRVRR
jgi:hypothetical protein